MKSVFNLGYVVGLVATLGLVACGSDSKKSDEPASTTTTVAYSEISAIVNESCATSGCHGGTQPPNFKSGGETEFKLNKASSISQINAGTMPKPNTTEATAFSADDKALVLKYLNQ